MLVSWTMELCVSFMMTGLGVGEAGLLSCTDLGDEDEGVYVIGRGEASLKHSSLPHTCWESMTETEEEEIKLATLSRSLSHS